MRWIRGGTGDRVTIAVHAVRRVVAVQYSKQELIRLLRRAGFPEAADDAVRDLPDPVDLERIEQWGIRRGITRDVLISQLGGSP